MSTRKNLFLDSLSPKACSQVLAVAQPVNLPLRTTLIEQEATPEHVYLLTSGIASVVIHLAEGGTAEVAIIGHEGLVGAINLLGPGVLPAVCFVRMAAVGYRIQFHAFKKLFLESEEIRNLTLEFAQQQSSTTAQLVACNKLHEAEARLARWLLMVSDRVQSNVLYLTQEFLAEMLGTRRTTVALVAGSLQRSGLLTYSRGKITILSRADLEEAACECYQVVARLQRDLYRQFNSFANGEGKARMDFRQTNNAYRMKSPSS